MSRPDVANNWTEGRNPVCGTTRLVCDGGTVVDGVDSRDGMTDGGGRTGGTAYGAIGGRTLGCKEAPATGSTVASCAAMTESRVGTARRSGGAGGLSSVRGGGLGVGVGGGGVEGARGGLTISLTLCIEHLENHPLVLALDYI